MPETLCWSCSRAYPGHGCCWADKFEPMPDWCAGVRLRYDANGNKTVSYHVYSCPLYDKEQRKKTKRNPAPQG